MKKAIYTISFLAYFIATSGLVVNYHYCMKKLASVAFYQTASNVCGTCGMETHGSKGCCHDELKVVKLEQDQNKAVTTTFDFSIAGQPVTIPSEFIAAVFENTLVQTHYVNHSPPLLSAQDTYLQNNVFRI